MKGQSPSPRTRDSLSIFLACTKIWIFVLRTLIVDPESLVDLQNWLGNNYGSRQPDSSDIQVNVLLCFTNSS